MVSWVKTVNPRPTRTVLDALSNGWATSCRLVACGAQKEQRCSPTWQEGTGPSGEPVLRVSSQDPTHNCATSLRQELYNRTYVGTRKDVPVSSMVKDLPISDASCKLNPWKPRRECRTSLSKFPTALNILLEKQTKKIPQRNKAFYLIEDIQYLTASI